jgi:hypothetical protein
MRPKEEAFHRARGSPIPLTPDKYNLFFLGVKTFGSLGIAVVKPRIWGCERASARSHPQIRILPREIPMIQTF